MTNPIKLIEVFSSGKLHRFQLDNKITEAKIGLVIGNFLKSNRHPNYQEIFNLLKPVKLKEVISFKVSGYFDDIVILKSYIKFSHPLIEFLFTNDEVVKNAFFNNLFTDALNNRIHDVFSNAMLTDAQRKHLIEGFVNQRINEIIHSDVKGFYWKYGFSINFISLVYGRTTMSLATEAEFEQLKSELLK